MVLSLGSGGEASLGEGMSTAWPRLEPRGIHLARRHQMVWQAQNTGSQPTFSGVI